MNIPNKNIPEKCNQIAALIVTKLVDEIINLMEKEDEYHKNFIPVILTILSTINARVFGVLHEIFKDSINILSVIEAFHAIQRNALSQFFNGEGIDILNHENFDDYIKNLKEKIDVIKEKNSHG